ncbi:transposase [Mesorhizobium sp. M0904]|uniref:transposase n=1 Tax=Mesorhizobium sp. M0904 TaxID=2957022 RepID=UPI003334C33A
MLDRERPGRKASPTAGVIDSQSIKAPEAATRGYDAGKKIVGRNRHIAVDPLWAAGNGQPHPCRYLRQCRGSVDSGWHPQALALVKDLFADGAHDPLKLMEKALP